MDAEVKAATITRFRIKEAARSVRREVAEFVYSYPGYTLEDAMEMPQGDRRLLLTYARLHQAEQHLQTASILAAVQSKAGFKSKINELKGVVKDLTQQL